MDKAFYLRLAISNVRRNRLTYLPYQIATAVIGGVYLLIAGLVYSDTLANLPSGNTASAVFAAGIAIFTLFALFFMTYIGVFLTGRRKKEFGLYALLGLERRHIMRVLVWENALVLLSGLALGAIGALVFGQLLFWLLLRVIHAAPGSAFSLAPAAFWMTGCLFLAVFIATSLLGMIKIRLSGPLDLMRSEKKGESNSRFLVPRAVLGLILLLGAYLPAFLIDSPGVAIGMFFPLSFLVIAAMYLLFTAGSIVVLRLLRANKGYYYRIEHFVTVSGLFHRMRQNARGLASICVLSIMLIVTVSGTLSLYLGQKEMLDGMYPYDAAIYVDDENANATEAALFRLAEEHHVTLSSDPQKLTREIDNNGFVRNNYLPEDAVFLKTKRLLCFNGQMRFDVDGDFDDCLAFVHTLDKLEGVVHYENVFDATLEGYGMYGGLLFLGVFFGVLFLAVTVLILYFKQITEGYEDKERFDILQKVGMDDQQVRGTINRQVLTVFFLPLIAAAVTMLFASRIMARMLQVFTLYNWQLVLSCIGGTLAVFALLYLLSFRSTARVYYRIVRRA